MRSLVVTSAVLLLLTNQAGAVCSGNPLDTRCKMSDFDGPLAGPAYYVDNPIARRATLSNCARGGPFAPPIQYCRAAAAAETGALAVRR